MSLSIMGASSTKIPRRAFWATRRRLGIRTPPRAHTQRPPTIDDRTHCVCLPARRANVSPWNDAQRQALDAALGLSPGWPR